MERIPITYYINIMYYNTSYIIPRYWCGGSGYYCIIVLLSCNLKYRNNCHCASEVVTARGLCGASNNNIYILYVVCCTSVRDTAERIVIDIRIKRTSTLTAVIDGYVNMRFADVYLLYRMKFTTLVSVHLHVPALYC